MYIKGNLGPIEVELPNGAKLNRSDLPPKSTKRWVASRKLVIVNAVKYGLISMDEACADYELSTEELNAWISATETHGPKALKVTSLAKFRQL
mgnify:CR=1 FL=1|tara:strand:- start:1790 stop:2068 length:279 start_codon:yes stop_codon:yes gene_type:complete